MPPKQKEKATLHPTAFPFSPEGSAPLFPPSGSESGAPSGATTPTGSHPPAKRQRSDTTPSTAPLPGFAEWKGDTRDYWLDKSLALTPRGKPPGPNQLSVIFCTFMALLQDHFTTQLDFLNRQLTVEREAPL